MRTEGQTDRHKKKLIIAFHNYANAPKPGGSAPVQDVLRVAIPSFSQITVQEKTSVKNTLREKDAPVGVKSGQSAT
jgi:hypothetical protein